MRFLSRFAHVLFTISLPFLFFSASIGWAVNSVWLYTSGFEKYGVSATTGLSKGELQKIAYGLITYWNSGEEFISLSVVKDGHPFELFNEREKAHLKDVKALFRFDYAVLLGTLLYSAGYSAVRLYRKESRLWLRGLVASSAATLAVMVLMGLIVLTGPDQFARFWLQFHLFSFANDLWQLDPAKDYLIMLVPQGFWYDAVSYVVFATAGMAVVSGGAAAAVSLLNKKEGK